MILLFLVCGVFAGTCDLVESDSVSAIVKVDGNTRTCVTPDELEDLINNKEQNLKCIPKLVQTEKVLKLHKDRSIKVDSAYALMSRSDSVMVDQVGVLKEVIAVTDTININLTEIKKLNEEKLKRCEDSKLTFMEKITIGVGIFLAGFLAGVI